jgi:hypothetical protein
LTSNVERMRAAAIALRNLALGGNMSTLTLGSPRSMVQYASEALFMRRALTGDRGLPEREVWQELPGADHVEIRLANVQTGSWPAVQPSYLADIVNLCRLCAALQPLRVFEIGTYTGFSTLHFALNSPPAARIHTLDLPKQGDGGNGDGGPAARGPALRTTIMDDAHIRGAVRESRYLFDGAEAAARIELLFGDSASFDFAPYHGVIDLFFIDGAHSYDYVRSDTHQALACVRPGGVVAWHDFGRTGLNGVSRWLLELRRRGWPVVAAPGGSLAFMVVPERRPDDGHAR